MSITLLVSEKATTGKFMVFFGRMEKSTGTDGIVQVNRQSLSKYAHLFGPIMGAYGTEVI